MNLGMWIDFNPHLQYGGYRDIMNEVNSILRDFTMEKGYGMAIKEIRFKFFIEEKIEFGRHGDGIYTKDKFAVLYAHLDAECFERLNASEKVKIALNGVLFLLNYWKRELAQPIKFDLNTLIADFEVLLAHGDFILSKSLAEGIMRKPVDSISFKFIVTTTIEVDDSKIQYDLQAIECFLTNELVGFSCGNDVRAFRIGYEIFDAKGRLNSFTSTAGYKLYSAKWRTLTVVCQFDFSKHGQLTPTEQFAELKKSILDGISGIAEMKRNPRGFDHERFHAKIDELLSIYGKMQFNA